MNRTVRSAFSYAAAFILASVAVIACGELTGPESPSTPTDVKATLLTATSVKVTWTPSPLNDGVISYSIFRNGTKVGESTTPEFTDTGLAQQTTYVYSVAANCKGGIVSDRSAETTQSTVTTVDTTPPTVITHQPPSNFNGVATGATVTATFSEPMDPNTINTTTFSLRVTSSGAAIPGAVTYNTTTRVAEFTPTSPLPNPVSITATVSTGAKDLAGNALAAAVTWAFTTRDETPPTVVSNSPTNGATVTPGSAVTITFSESVQASTVNTSNISLTVASTGTNIPGTLTFNGTNVITFTPSAPLAQGNYTFTVNGVKDLAGNLMPAPFIVNFTVDATPPTVASVSPTGGQMGVATNTAVQITFSESMDAATITNATILLRNTVTSALVPATVTYNTTTKIATLTPSGPLSNATNYTVVVTTSVKDLAGNPLATQFESTFTTAALADTTAPTIITRSPAISATNVALNANVTLTFSEAIDPTTINSSNITLKPTSGGANISATVTCNSPCTTATLDPTSDLANNTSYTVTVSPSIKDLAGNLLGPQPVWTFTTLNDVIAPSIVPPTSPVDGATNVPRNATVSVTFSEDMNASTVNTTTFNVKTDVGSVPVAGSVFYNTFTRVATFTPTGNLAANTKYIVTVTSGATDLAGNHLPLTSTFSFTTGGT